MWRRFLVALAILGTLGALLILNQRDTQHPCITPPLQPVEISYGAR